MNVRLLLPLIIMFVVAILAALVLSLIVKVSDRAKPMISNSSKKWHFFIILSGVIMILSWLFNFGWLRVVLTWIPIPLIHLIAFVIINAKVANLIGVSDRFKRFLPISCLTFLLAYLLFPDVGDVGGGYAFFTLIRNDVIVGIFQCVSLVLFGTNVIILFVEFMELRRFRS